MKDENKDEKNVLLKDVSLTTTIIITLIIALVVSLVVVSLYTIGKRKKCRYK